MLSILVPFTVVNPEVVEGAPSWAEWVDVSGDKHAYRRTLAQWWTRGETFMVLEHDVVCRPDVVEQFESCPEPWCLFSYDNMCCEPCREAWRNMLGCTRFRAELIAAVPDA